MLNKILKQKPIIVNIPSTTQDPVKMCLALLHFFKIPINETTNTIILIIKENTYTVIYKVLEALITVSAYFNYTKK